MRVPQCHGFFKEGPCIVGHFCSRYVGGSDVLKSRCCICMIQVILTEAQKL